MNRTLIALLFCYCLLACQSAKEPDVEEVVVIGGGLMGSATAWQLAKQGKEVQLIEKQDSVYTEGSSYGEARIARSNNRGNDIWSYLHNRSVSEVQSLIAYLNEGLANPSFKIEDIYTTSAVTYVGRSRIYDRLMASLERQEIKYDIATTKAEGEEKYNVSLPDSVLMQREYNLHSGMINPSALIQHLHHAIIKKGSQVHYNAAVTQITYDSTRKLYQLSVDENGDQRTIYAQKVVSAAGPYTGTLLGDIAPYLDTLINPQRVFLAFLKVNAAVYDNMTVMQQQKLQNYYPVINSSAGTRSGSFFSMIEYYDEQKHPIIKIGGHFQRSPITDLPEIWQTELSQSEIEWSLNSTAGYFKMLNLPVSKEDLEVVDGYSCVYSLTASEVPIVSPLIQEDGNPNSDVVVLGGMSGVGAKGAMTYGLIAANLLLQKEEQDSMYQVTAKALGFDRLRLDVLGK